MVLNRKTYRWFYDHIHCRYYNLLTRWCFLPFGGEKKFREEMLTSIDFQSQDKILDMCCGTGNATFAIAKKAAKKAEIIGIDLSSGQINFARRKNYNVYFMVMDAIRTGFKDCYFDKVFITHAIHEMSRKIRLDTLNEARRILKEKGRVIILELDNPKNLLIRLFIGFWFFYWLPFNFETPTRKDMLKQGLTNEVKEAGFRDIIKISKYKGVFQMVAGNK
jgi:demethylmenaquinone methyltransferase/2-methoxy-6-polyprenyl-1,4-benzoquinol methylase